MRNPFQRREVRESYSNTVTSALLAAATGKDATSPLRTGALETCAIIWARVLSAANSDHPAVTSALLATIGHELIRKGEALFLTDAKDGQLTLRPVDTWTVTGGPDPSSWIYQATRTGPSSAVTRRVGREGVAHFMWMPSVRRPWEGIPPLGFASTAGRMAAGAERELGNICAIPAGAAVPYPEGTPAAGLRRIHRTLKNIRGGLTAVESTAGGRGDPGAKPGGDWIQRNFGPEPTEGFVSAFSMSCVGVWSACGIPVELIGGKSDGTALREAWRRFALTSVEPVAKVIAAELSRALEAPITLDLAGLAAIDITGRARAFRSLVENDVTMTPAIAAQITGLGLARPETGPEVAP